MTDAGICQKGDSIIFFLQEAEFPRRTSTGFHVCDGESISGIEIIEILRISCNVGSRHRVLPYSPGKLTRFLYLERIGGFGMENGLQIMRFCLYIEVTLAPASSAVSVRPSFVITLSACP